MARHIFPGDTHLLPSGAPATNAAFTVWSDRIGGLPYTDVLASDGVSPATLATDASGNRPYLMGPDGIEVMYVDTGASIRYPVYADDQERLVLDETFLAQVQSLAAQVANLQAQLNSYIAGGGGGTGTGGSYLPASSTLETIPNGSTRLAFTQAERDKLGQVAAGATRLLVGTAATDAKAGNYQPTPSQIGAVAAVDGGLRMWKPRTASQSLPTAAEGALDGDMAFQDAS